MYNTSFRNYFYINVNTILFYRNKFLQETSFFNGKFKCNKNKEIVEDLYNPIRSKDIPFLVIRIY